MLLRCGGRNLVSSYPPLYLSSMACYSFSYYVIRFVEASAKGDFAGKVERIRGSACAVGRQATTPSFARRRWFDSERSLVDPSSCGPLPVVLFDGFWN